MSILSRMPQKARNAARSAYAKARKEGKDQRDAEDVAYLAAMRNGAHDDDSAEEYAKHLSRHYIGDSAGDGYEE